MSTAHNERGAAMIIVLGLVAIVAAWAANAAYEDMLSLRQADNAQLSLRAELACLSALKLARLALEEDGKNSQVDSLEEDWAMPATPFPLDDGLVMGEIEDSNRFFNLNDLVNDQGLADRYSVAQVKRLFTQLDLDANMVDALIDWMDADNKPFGVGGVEADGYYDRKYSIKNARLDRWNELRMVIGFDAKTVKILSNVVTVRPVYAGVKTLININTAKKPVLQMLFPKMTDGDADAMIEARPYNDLTAINNQPWVAGGDLLHLGVNSDMFFLHAQASFGHIHWRENYLLERKSGRLTLLWRERIIWQP
ncbi:MAG: type II secretion system minor pseudopilin GspK [Mariprofundaceae bacterium]|nr:type II secretion system minor pseudopilin GspK [Mariprofundaceae bacterium]